MSFKNRLLILKITEHCNSNCLYCYLPDEVKTNIKTSRMSNDTLELLFDRIEKEAEGQIGMLWHGGEPFLLGAAFYKKILEREKEISNRKNIKFKNRAQTNGTLVNDNLLDILGQNFRIGVSLDGPEAIHNSLRQKKDGTGTYSFAVNAIKKIHARNWKCGTLTVITTYHIGNEEKIYAEYKRLSLTSVKLNHLFITGHCKQHKEIAPNTKQLFNFYKKMYDLWVTDSSGNKIILRPFDDMIRIALGIKPDLCVFKNCNTKNIEIDPTGEVYSCGRFIGMKEFSLGNIHNQTLNELAIRRDKLFQGITPKYLYSCPFESYLETGFFNSAPIIGKVFTKLANYIKVDLENRLK